MEFIRFGNLTSQYHKIPDNIEDRCMHTAPVSKGIYAFPKGYIEPFLLGGIGSGSLQNGRFSKFKDKNGKPYKIKGSEFEEFKKNKFPTKISKRLFLSYTWEDWYYKNKDNDDVTYEDYEKELNEGIWYVLIRNNPIHFEYNGLIWHHLFNYDNPVKDKEYPNYIKIIDCWVLTDMKTYQRCLNRYVAYSKLKSSFIMANSRNKSSGFNYLNQPYPYSKDEFEVYIESIQKDNKNIKHGI